MKKVLLESNQTNVSEFCLGTMLMGTAMDRSSSYHVLDHFMSNQGNFIDTANCYAWWLGKGEFIGDESEALLGDWMQSRNNRNEIYLATKVGCRVKDPYHIRDEFGNPQYERLPEEYEGLSAKTIKSAVEDSLRRLKTDYIDLLFTHAYDVRVPIDETLGALTDLVKEGKVKHIGASNISTEQLKDAMHVSAANHYAAYSVIQQEYSYLHPKKEMDTGIFIHADDEMLAYAAEENISFMAYSPLLKGIYTNPQKRLDYYNWHIYESDEAIRRLDRIENLSKKLGITGNQLVLAWLLHQKNPIIPLLGFSRTEQYMESIKACDIRIPEEILAELNQ